jgi:hypothetical protein
MRKHVAEDKRFNLQMRVEPLGRDDDIRDTHFLQGAMKVVADGPSLVAVVELDARAAGILYELESLFPSHLERGLRGSVADLATHGDLVRVDIQTEFDFDDVLGRSLGLLLYCILFHMEPTVWSGSRQLSAYMSSPMGTTSRSALSLQSNQLTLCAPSVISG